MTFEEFFRQAYGKQSDNSFNPYDYQCRLAEEPWPDLLGILSVVTHHAIFLGRKDGS